MRSGWPSPAPVFYSMSLLNPDAATPSKQNLVSTRPKGPRFPIHDLSLDLLDRLPPSKEDAKLFAMKLDDNELREMNAEVLCSRFPSLNRVSARRNKLTRILCFPWFANLRELYLDGNSLTVNSITASSWKACARRLEILGLSRNRLDIVVADHLSVLKALRELDLRGNPCVEEDSYRDTLCSKIPSLNKLDDIKTKTAMVPLYQDNKQRVHPDVFNKALDDVREQSSVKYKEDLEAQLRHAKSSFESQIQMEKDNQDENHRREIKSIRDQVRRETMEEVTENLNQRHEATISQLKLQHETSVKRLEQQAKLSEEIAVQQASMVVREETTEMLNARNNVEMERRAAQINETRESDISALKRKFDNELERATETAARQAKTETAEEMSAKYEVERKRGDDEFQARLRNIERQFRDKYDEGKNVAVNAAVSAAIEKVVGEREELRDEVLSLRKKLNATEKQFAIQERVLGWGKAKEDDESEAGAIHSSENFNDAVVKKDTALSIRQTANGYTRLLATWRQKVFELLIPTTERKLEISDQSSSSNSNKMDNRIAVMQAKLEFAQSEVAQSRASEKARIRAEERASFLATSLEELKDRHRALASKVSSLAQQAEAANSLKLENGVVEKELVKLQTALKEKEAEMEKNQGLYSESIGKLKQVEMLKIEIQEKSREILSLSKGKSNLQKELDRSLLLLKEKESTLAAAVDSQAKLERTNAQLRNAVKLAKDQMATFSPKLDAAGKQLEESSAREAGLKDQIERIEKVSEERGSDLNAMKQKIMKARNECANIVVNVLEPIISEMKNHMPSKRMIQAVNKLNIEQKAKFDEL